MAEDTKPAAHAAKADAHEEVDVLKEANKEIVDHARKVLRDEAKHEEHTDGPADNRSGSTAKSAADLFGANPDPYARAFPPGPDDPYVDEK
jgi:hypothetical protein